MQPGEYDRSLRRLADLAKRELRGIATPEELAEIDRLEQQVDRFENQQTEALAHFGRLAD